MALARGCIVVLLATIAMGLLYMTIISRRISDCRSRLEANKHDIDVLLTKKRYCQKNLKLVEEEVKSAKEAQASYVSAAENKLLKARSAENFCLWQDRKEIEKSQELQAKIRHVAGNLMEGDSVKVAILQKALAELIGVPERSIDEMELTAKQIHAHIISELVVRIGTPREVLQKLPITSLVNQVQILSSQ
eukprot:m.5577 g.5577  ORF g.5577 m.5577 type:complete len:191 (-) comp3334_c0_seq1:3494-4066(-)